jgi:hypothetical protein
MNLKETAKRGIDIVSLTDCSMEDLDRMLTTFHINDLRTE